MAHQLPTRFTLHKKLLALRRGNASRADVAAWACEIINDDALEVGDEVAWEVLQRLGGADLIALDRPYLYDVADFDDWLEDLRGNAIARAPE